MIAISRQTPEFYTDHPTQNIYGKKKIPVIFITLQTLIVSVYSYHGTNLTYIEPNTGFVLSQWGQLSPALYLLLVVQVYTTTAGFTENSNWAPHLLRPVLTMYIYIGKCFIKILIWDHWTIWQQTLLECTLVGSLQNVPVCFLCHQLFKMATTTGHNVVLM